MSTTVTTGDCEVLLASAQWSKGSLCDGQELLPCVVQSDRTGRVLMLGYLSRESLRQTMARGRMVFYSRSRHELWCKGDSSGNFFSLRALSLDCDGDTFLAVVDEQGPACHRNVATCFDDSSGRTEPDLHTLPEVFDSIYKQVSERAQGRDPESYTFRLLSSGRERILKKLGEEATETVIAAMSGNAEAFRQESADLIFHLLVACVEMGVPPADILRTLRDRQGVVRRDGSVPLSP